MKLKKLLLLLLSTSIISTPIMASQNKNAPLLTKQNQLEYVKQQIEKNQNVIQNVIEQTEVVYSEMQQINDLIQENKSNLSNLEDQISEKQSRIESLENEIYLNQNYIQDSFVSLSSSKELIMSSVDKRNVSAKSLSNKVNQMNTLFDIYEEVTSSVLNTTTSIRELEGTIRLERENISKEKNLVTSKQSIIQEKYDSKLLEFTDLNKQKMKVEDNMDSLSVVSEQLVSAIQQLQSFGYSTSKPVNMSNNKMSWPTDVKGYITSYYSDRVNPVTGKQEVHTALDIGGLGYGRAVLASAEGIVISSGEIPGYGYTVILDHGDGISTLYAHNQKLLVKEGQEIQRGQQIAEVGSTGRSTGPHIHFEVRVDGKPVDPANWLPSEYLQ